MWYHLFVVLHLIGITAMAGATLIDYILFRQMWLHTSENRLFLSLSNTRLTKIASLGGALLVITGIAMLLMLKGIYGTQLWFKVKMVLVVLILINAFTTGGKFRRRLQGASAGGTTAAEGATLVAGANFFYVSQLSLFALIYILSVFKFS